MAQQFRLIGQRRGDFDLFLADLRQLSASVTELRFILLVSIDASDHRHGKHKGTKAGSAESALREFFSLMGRCLRFPPALNTRGH